MNKRPAPPGQAQSGLLVSVWADFPRLYSHTTRVGSHLSRRKPLRASGLQRRRSPPELSGHGASLSWAAWLHLRPHRVLRAAGGAGSRSAAGLDAGSRRPSSLTGGSAPSSGSNAVMSQPRRLRTRRPSSVETMARNPSHFTSKDQPEPEGSGPGRDSISSGSRRLRTYWSETTPGSQKWGTDVTTSCRPLQKTKASPVVPRREPTLQRHARQITCTATQTGMQPVACGLKFAATIPSSRATCGSRSGRSRRGLN
jgi:hypothetical protein